MNPRTVELLSKVIGRAQAVADRPAITCGDAGALDALRDEIDAARDWPADAGDPRRLVDATAFMLAQCLCNVAGAGLDRDQAARWRAIAAAYVPFVQADLAIALDLIARPTP